jgi:hypothetical protein
VRRERFALHLSLVVAAGLAVRVAYVLIARRDTAVFGDASSYHLGANLLADGDGFIDPLRYGLAGMRVESAYHPPLYVVYLAGWSLFGFDGPLAHRLASCAIGAATVAVIGVLGRRVAGDRAGLIAAGLAALYPALWLNDGSLLSESAAAFAIALALLAIERFRSMPSLGRAAVLGGAVGLAALGRAEVILLAPFVVLPLALLARALPWRERWLRVGAAAAGTIVVIGPWVGYNLTRFDEPVLLSTGLGPVLSSGACDIGFYGEKLGYWAECGIPQREVPPPDPATLRSWREDPEGTRVERQAYIRSFLEGEPDESVYDRQGREQAYDYIGDHASRYPVVVAARAGRIWNVFRPWQNATFDGRIEGRGIGWARVAIGTYYVLVAFAVGGLIVLRRRGQPIWTWLVLAGIVTVTAGLTFGVQRYRIPVDVALPVLAAVAVDHLVASRTRARDRDSHRVAVSA